MFHLEKEHVSDIPFFIFIVKVGTGEEPNFGDRVVFDWSGYTSKFLKTFTVVTWMYLSGS